MKHILIAGLFCILSINFAYGWRPYNRFRLGSFANSIGAAYTAYAESEIAVHHNPAGLVQIQSGWGISYEVYANVVIPDILQGNYIRINMDYFPFFGLIYGRNKMRFGLSVSTIFDSYFLNDLHVRSVKLSFAYPVLDNLAVGGGAGPVIATEGDGRGFAFAYNIGILWKISQRVQTGLVFHSPFFIEWQNSVSGFSLRENYPMIIEGGIALELSERVLLFAGLEFINIDSITYELNNQNRSPEFDNNLLSRIHPRIGIEFSEPIIGARLSFGFMTDSSYHTRGGQNQYLLTAGVKAYGRRGNGNIIFSGSIVDSLLLSLINPDNTREVKITMSLSFRIPD